MQTEYFIIHKMRPNPLPNEHLPLGLLSVGHFHVCKGPIPPVRYPTHAIIAWGICGSFKITIDNIGEFVLSSEKIIVITPGKQFCLEALTDNSELRYIAIDGPQSECAVLKAGLWTGIFPCREVPLTWLKGLEELVVSEDQDDQILGVSRAHDLIMHQADIVKGLVRDNLVYHAQWYIHKNWRNCDINIESVVSELNVDRTTLSTRFKNETGLTMLEYITQLRISGAKRMLMTTSTNVSEVAKMCGFSDPSYFARLFHKKTGISPIDYRLGNTPISAHKSAAELVSQK